MKRIDIPAPQQTDPVVGRALQRIMVDVGPPAAVAVVFVELRQSGVARELPPVQLGDAVPEEVLAGLPPKDAARLRSVDDRGDRATRFLNRVLKPNFIAEIVADLVENGEV